jgi:uncharacterized membrane protein YjjP (DUF1212 family)
MITWALIASTVIALVLVALVQGKWTSRDSWFAAVFASAVMAMVIDHYINHINLRVREFAELCRRCCATLWAAAA